MILEYARIVLGFRGASHAEYDPYEPTLSLGALSCSLAGQLMRVNLAPGARVAAAYDSTVVTQEYDRNFGIEPTKAALLSDGDLVIVGVDADGEIRVVELPSHPSFVGTVFVPQTRSTLAVAHLLVSALAGAATRASPYYGESRHHVR